MRGLKIRSADTLADWSVGIAGLVGAGTVKEALDAKMPKSGGIFTGTVSDPDNAVLPAAAVNLAQVEDLIAAIPAAPGVYAGAEDVFTSDGTVVVFNFVNIPTTITATPNRVFVFVDGIRQSKTSYTLSTTAITLGSAAPTGSVIEVCLL